MARFLALDWDHQQLHVVAAAVGGKTVRIEKAAVFAEDKIPNPAEAEALGQALRARLKEAGIAPAPVLACLGRDRLILKEVRFPAVAAGDEPALVRFQATKDLSHPVEEVVLDYAPIGEGQAGGEQRVLALLVRRELLEAYQRLCQAAGLKLAALVPRPFALLACLQGTLAPAGAAPGPGSVAILSLAARSAELCVAKGNAVLFARSLAGGEGLQGEVRRNLAVYSGQWPGNPIQSVYVTDGGSEHTLLRQRLHEFLALPVEALNPFAQSPGTRPGPGLGGSFAAAVGLLYAQGQGRALAVNFVRPKEPRPPSNTNRRRLVIAAALVATFLVGLVGLGYAQITNLDSQVALLQEQKMALDRQLVLVEEDGKRIAALTEWAQGDVNWLDELYDLTDRFPDTQNLRLVELRVDPITRNGKGKAGANHVARVSLKGINNENFQVLDTLMAHLVEEGHYRVEPKQSKRNMGIDRNRYQLEFMTRVEVEKRLPTQYTRRLKVDREEPGSRDRGSPGEFGAFEGGQP